MLSLECNTVYRENFLGSNFRVFHDTEPFHEFLTRENLLSWVEKQNFDSQKSNINQNTIRPHENIPLYSMQFN